MSKTRRIFLFVALPLLAVFSIMVFYHLYSNPVPASVKPNDGSPGGSEGSSEGLVFSHQIFDPTKVSHITPLGELNGGHIEAQAIAGVMVNNRQDIISDSNMLDVFAPIDMALEGYAHYDMPPGGEDWSLSFRLSKNVTMRLDHITQPVEKIVAVTSGVPKKNSSEENPKQKLRFAAGEKIAQTRGTNLAKNWNIYIYDHEQVNTFVNQKRYDSNFDRSTGYKLTHSSCVFDYYSQEMKVAYLALMGATKAGQANNCGNTSKDVSGTLSGMWHFGKDDIREERDNQYLSPLSVYRNSAGQIIIADLGDGRFDLENAVDPATVKDSHCYALINQNNNRPAGYAYFNLVSESEMQLAYSASGNCPSAFPTAGTKTYYR